MCEATTLEEPMKSLVRIARILLSLALLTACSTESEDGSELKALTADTGVTQSLIQYQGADGKTYKAAVFVPAGRGRFPLFVWIPGTIDSYDTPVALRIARTMAERGVVSVTVGYNNAVADGGGCANFDAKTSGLQAVHAINGESDFIYGDANVNRDQVQKVAGTSALSSALLVTAKDLKAPAAGHNYYQTSEHAANPVWDTTTEAWGRKPSQDWIVSRLSASAP